MTHNVVIKCGEGDMGENLVFIYTRRWVHRMFVFLRYFCCYITWCKTVSGSLISSSGSANYMYFYF
jgi:hypothetical protein